MIVVMKWYAGEGSPELDFYPDGESQAGDIAHTLATEMSTGKECIVYSVADLAKPPIMIYPQDERRMPF